MRTDKIVLSAALATAAALFVLAPATAQAGEYGPVSYANPEGWETYPGKCPGVCLSRGKGKIMLTLESGGTAKAIAEKRVGTVIQGGEAGVAGQPGYFAVGTRGATVLAAAAAPTEGNNFVVFLLETTKETLEADLGGWAAMIDGASIKAPEGGGGGGDGGGDGGGNGGGGGGNAGFGDGGSDYGDRDRQPQKYTVELVNAGVECTAPMSLAGQDFRLAPGETRTLELAAGDYEFRYQDQNGASKSGRFNVPKYTKFGGACKRPAPEAPPPPPPSEDPPPRAQGSDGSAYYAVLADKRYKWEDIAFDTGISNTWTFKAGDANCPLAFRLDVLAVGGGPISLVRTYVGCAFFLGDVDGSPAGSGHSWWKFQVLYYDIDGKKGETNELFWQNQMKIYTDGVKMLSPRGFYGNQKIEGKWALFQ